MIGTAREIAVEMLKQADIHAEKYVYACWNSEDIRCVTGDWELSVEELNEVMRRFSSCLESGSDVSLIQDVVRIMLDDQRKKRSVAVPAASLEIVMQLAGKELERTGGAGQVGENSSAPLKKERDAMRILCAALDA